jgi:hypothetical protein
LRNKVAEVGPDTQHVQDVAALKVEVEHLIKAVESLTKQVESITEQVNKWRGGIILLLALGAISGWVIDHAVKLLLVR